MGLTVLIQSQRVNVYCLETHLLMSSCASHLSAYVPLGFWRTRIRQGSNGDVGITKIANVCPNKNSPVVR